MHTLFRSGLVTIGRFRCPPGDPRWHRENWIGDRPHLVFPHVPVAIRQHGRDAVVADPNQVVLYRTGTHYRRRLLSPDGDRSTFLTVEPGAGPVLADAIGSTEITSQADEVLRVHLLAALCARTDVDPMLVEEQAMVLVGRILMRATAGRVTNVPARRGARRSRTRQAHDDLVADAQRYLGDHLTEPRSLAEIGAAVGASPFHLARMFRARTGLGLHAYRDQLRLRTAVDRLGDNGPDLAALAVDIGYASHSHLDERFRRTFGRSPSAVRALLRRGEVETRTLLEVLRAMPA